MWPVSAVFLRTIRDSHESLASLQYHNGDGAWRELTVVDGQVTADRGSQTRWSLDATVTGVDMSEQGLNAYTSRLQAYRGVRLPSEQVEWVPLGQYRVESVSADVGADTLAVTGLSREIVVSDSKFLTPRTVRGDAEAAVTTLIREAIPDAYVDFRAESTQLGPITEDADRWTVIDGDSDDPSIGRALGAEVYTDGIGRFVVAPVPTIQDEPVWIADEGVLVTAAHELSRDGVYNVVVASPESTEEGADNRPGYAWDDDPASPTFAGYDPLNPMSTAGPFGLVVQHYSSSALKTYGDCVRAAQGILADSLGLAQQVSFTSLANPALVPGDVVRVAPPGERPGNHVIDSLSIDLIGGASIETKTRTTRTRTP